MVTDVGEISPRQGPLLTYHQWKFRLYRIMGPFLGRRLQSNRLETVRAIHGQLVAWERELPDSLRLEKYGESGSSGDAPLIQLAALALQLTYDNLRIILHRSVAFGDIGHEVGLAGRVVETESTAFSRQQLLESALRTSELYRYSHLLQASRRTHAVMHIGICLFTSGVVLCALSLMEPLSITSQKAKAGIMQIIRLQKESVSNQHVLSLQSVRILEDLVNVVMQAEQRTILGGPIPASISQPKGRAKRVADNEYTGISQSQTNMNENSGGANTTTQASLTPLQEGKAPDVMCMRLWDNIDKATQCLPIIHNSHRTKWQFPLPTLLLPHGKMQERWTISCQLWTPLLDSPGMGTFPH